MKLLAAGCGELKANHSVQGELQRKEEMSDVWKIIDDNSRKTRNLIWAQPHILFNSLREISAFDCMEHKRCR